MPDESAFLKWQYIAPHRAVHRFDSNANSAVAAWGAIRDLNEQRFARVMEFQTTIAFVGSGLSKVLGYPGWNEIFKAAHFEGRADSQVAEILNPKLFEEVDAQSIFEILAERLSDAETPVIPRDPTLDRGRDLGDNHDGRRLMEECLIETFRQRQEDLEENLTDSRLLRSDPYPDLLKLPIRRFITTNYDRELERVLRLERRALIWREEDRSFTQGDPGKAARFAVANAPDNHYMVFHCHGAVKGDGKQAADLVLTETDYKYWYLKEDGQGPAFRESLEVVLQSNPLLIVGFGLADPDLVRTFRQLSIMRKDRTGAIFVLLNRTRYGVDAELELMAAQNKFGVSILDFEAPEESWQPNLREKIIELRNWRKRREDWRKEPRALPHKIAGKSLLRPVSEHDPLFGKDKLREDREDIILRNLKASLDRQQVVMLSGRFGSGKYLKVCQFVAAHWDERPYLVFSAHGNEDVYSYLNRIVTAIETEVKITKGSGGIVERLKDALSRREAEKLLIVISGFERFLRRPASAQYPGGPETKIPSLSSAPAIDGASSDNPATGSGRNALAGNLISFLIEWNKNAVERNKNADRKKSHFLLTTSSGLDFLGSEAGVAITADTCPFTIEQLASSAPGNTRLTDEAFAKLKWELRDQPGAMPIAAAFVLAAPSGKPIDASQSREDMDQRLDSIIGALHFAPDERGTRVVRQVIRSLDEGHEHIHLSLLVLLSCFNRPFRRVIIRRCFDHLLKGMEAKLGPPGKGARITLTSLEVTTVTETLRRHRLLEAIGPEELGGHTKQRYIVPPLVKRYCQVISGGREEVVGRSFGLNGYSSGGPFNSPGRDARKILELFRFFEQEARLSVRKLLSLKAHELSPEKARSALNLIRAVFEILRSNFACNSVARWGAFPTFLDMCANCFDLVKNYCIAVNKIWTPGDCNSDYDDGGDEKFPAPLTAEENLWLLNELGLAYYATGNLQDAVSIWGLASDWQRAVALTHPDQGIMYAASIDCHLGMAFMYFGRLDTANSYLLSALAHARTAQHWDLEARIYGLLGRVHNLRGDYSTADEIYTDVINRLGQTHHANPRAKSYFMGYQALLKARLGKFEEATVLAKTSFALAASENHPDAAEDARALQARIESMRENHKDALREFRIALTNSQKFGMRALEAEVRIGMARTQIELGDASAAKHSAFQALKLANDGLLALRQVDALLIIGQAYRQLGDHQLAMNYIELARLKASQSGFRVQEREAVGALADLGARISQSF